MGRAGGIHAHVKAGGPEAQDELGWDTDIQPTAARLVRWCTPRAWNIVGDQ